MNPLLRESYSLDPFPDTELTKLNSDNNRINKVSIISNNNNNSKNFNKNTSSDARFNKKRKFWSFEDPVNNNTYLADHTNNNNNPISHNALERQTSLIPENIPLLMHKKRWHSLDCGASGLGCDNSYDENILLQNKKSLGRRLLGKIFPNNGYTPRASNTSLKKIGLIAGNGSDPIRKTDSENLV